MSGIHHIVLKYLDQISKLEDFQMKQQMENLESIYTNEYAQKYRRGLRVVPYALIRQKELYLRGFYFHLMGYHDTALIFYS